MPLSTSPILRYFTLIPASITLYYAYTYFIHPEQAQQIFELTHLPSGRDTQIFYTLMALLGSKVTIIGLSLYLAVFFAPTRYLGGMVLLASGMAGMDGLVVGKYVGHGEWNHWGYGSALAVQGLVMLGLLDGLFGSGVKKAKTV